MGGHGSWWSVGWWGWACLGVALLVAVLDAVVRERDRRIWDTLPKNPPNRDLGPVQIQELRRVLSHDTAAVVVVELAVRGHLRIHDPGAAGGPVVIRRVRDADSDDLRPYEVEFLEVLGDEAVATEDLGVRLSRLVSLATHEQVWELPWVRTYLRPVWPESNYAEACGTHSLATGVLGVVGAGLVVLDLAVWHTFGSLAMLGAAALVLGVMALLRRLRLDALCQETLDRVIGNWSGTFGYSAAVRKRPHENLPYAFAFAQYHWLEWYADEHARNVAWYSYDGAEKDFKKRFVALGGMFRGGYPRPAYVRSPSTRPSGRVARSGGFAGGYGDAAGLDSGGHGHGGGVGSGDGGGHGGSW